MLENIFVGIMGVIVVGAAAFAWWFENGKESKSRKQDTEHTEK